MPTLRRNGELVRGVFEVLMDAPEGRLAAADVLTSVEKRVPPTPEEQEDYASSPGVRRFEKVVRFATIGPVKAGWLVKDKGIWTLTDDGRAAYDAFPDPLALQREWTRLYGEWKKSQPPPGAGDGEDEVDEAETGAATTLEEAEESAWAEIRDYIRRMPPYDFQDLVAALLKAMGYHVLWVAPPGPDRGVDMIAHNDPLGATAPRIKVQVKRRADTIGREGVSAFIGTVGAIDVGIFVSTGGFTTDAEREARSNEGRRITLIGLDRLVELWIENFDRLNDSARQMLPLKPVYFLVPEG